MLQLYDMAKAKEDHTERVAKADQIKADIAKTLDAVFDANNVLQVQNKIKQKSCHMKSMSVVCYSNLPM